MATYGPYQSFSSLVAGADLSAAQYTPVKLASTAGEVVACSAATDRAIGVLMNDPADGQPAEVAINGVVPVLAEASVTLGAYVAPSTTGRAKVTTTANDDPFGIALDASTNAGEMIRVLLTHFNY